MKCRAFVGGTAILPDQEIANAVVVFSNKIETVSNGVEPRQDVELIDVAGKYIVPGFIDIHVHGGGGADFMDGTLAAVVTAARSHLSHGTTTLFPTTTTGSPEQILAMIRACQDASQLTAMPSLPGIHLYGPFFAEDKVGCHSVSGRRSPTQMEYDAYFATDFVRIATCAAELDGAERFYRTARARNCFITCGHSNASWTEMQAAFDVGMRHVDHFWCAMSSVPSLRKRLGIPMQASMAEFVLINSEMSTEVIADGWHLAPQLLEFAYRMLGPKRLCLVTDCNRALDLEPGEYRFGNASDGSWFRSDGNVGWSQDGTSLASSIVGMDHMVRHMHQSTTATLAEVIRMASLTPAERTGIETYTGSLSVGKNADLLVLNRDLVVEQVYLRGERVDVAASNFDTSR